MKCLCKHCTTEYNNDKDYMTSICDECFKKFNENQLQPLKDALKKADYELFSLKTKLDFANTRITQLEREVKE